MNYGMLRGFLQAKSLNLQPNATTPTICNFNIFFYTKNPKTKELIQHVIPVRVFGNKRIEKFLKIDVVAGDEVRIIYSLSSGFFKDTSSIYLNCLECFKTGYNIKKVQKAIYNIEDERAFTWNLNIDDFEDIDTF